MLQFFRHYLENKSGLKKLIKFGTTGAICVIVDFSVVFISKEKFGIDKNFSNIYGTLCGLITNYLINRKWTFRSKQPWKKEFIKFVSISTIGFLFNIMIVYYGTDICLSLLTYFCKNGFDLFYCNNLTDWSFYVTKMAAIVIVFFWNFYINYRFNFNNKKNK